MQKVSLLSSLELEKYHPQNDGKKRRKEKGRKTSLSISISTSSIFSGIPKGVIPVWTHCTTVVFYVSEHKMVSHVEVGQANSEDRCCQLIGLLQSDGRHASQWFTTNTLVHNWPDAHFRFHFNNFNLIILLLWMTLQASNRLCNKCVHRDQNWSLNMLRCG